MGEKAVKWQKARDRDGNLIERADVSDVGCKVARYTLAGKDLYRASFQGAFIHMPVEDKAEAVKACDRHYAAKR